MSEAVMIATALVVLGLLALGAWAGIPQYMWWVLAERARFRRRADLYVKHNRPWRSDGSGRCHCVNCMALRREMGWEL